MTDNSSFLREVDDDLRRERLEKIWKKYGRFLIGAGLVLVVGTGALTVYRNHENKLFEQSTSQLAGILQQLKPENGEAIRQQLSDAAAKMPAGDATLTRLYALGLAKDADRDAALAELAKIGETAGLAPVYRELTKLLSVQLRLDHEDPAKLIAELQPLQADGQPWRWSAREFAALLALKTGDTATAARLFTALKNDGDTPDGIRSRAARLAATLPAPTEEK